MKNYARVLGGIAVDVCLNPETHFHPSLVKEFVEVPDVVLSGWVLTGTTWAAPAPVVPPVANPAETGNLKPSPMEFLLLLTLSEQISIRSAADSDAGVKVLVTMLDDPRLTFVDLGNATVIEAIQYLTTTTPALLTQERAARLLKGLGPVAAPAAASESAS